jgi:hypothetical protein
MSEPYIDKYPPIKSAHCWNRILKKHGPVFSADIVMRGDLLKKI